MLRPLMEMFAEWTVVQEASPCAIDSTVTFDDHAESLPQLLGIIVPFLVAVRHYRVAPDFDQVVHNIVVNGSGNGAQAIECVKRFFSVDRQAELPGIEELKHVMEKRVSSNDENAVVDVIRSHLDDHECYDVADLVVGQSKYEQKFPLAVLKGLKDLHAIPLQDWSSRDAARAAVAANAFCSEFMLVNQVKNYDWLNEQKHLVETCVGRLFEVLKSFGDSEVEFEQRGAVKWPPQTFAGGQFPISGIRGRFDAVAKRSGTSKSELLEFKFTTNLSDEHKIQLFLYLLISATNKKKPRFGTGTLYNFRTGERLCVRMRDDAPPAEPEAVLRAAVDIHFDRETSLEDIMRRFCCEPPSPPPPPSPERRRSSRRAKRARME